MAENNTDYAIIIPRKSRLKRATMYDQKDYYLINANESLTKRLKD